MPGNGGGGRDRSRKVQKNVPGLGGERTRGSGGGFFWALSATRSAEEAPRASAEGLGKVRRRRGGQNPRGRGAIRKGALEGALGPLERRNAAPAAPPWLLVVPTHSP